MKWFRANTAEKAADGLHRAVVAAARRPGLYAQLCVPDTPWGRIESVMLHALLVVRQLSAKDSQPLAHGLVDAMFAEFDRGLRQTGVGDLSVPKKMVGLGGDWLARIEVYGPALDSRDEQALAAALARNVLGEPDAPDAALPLASHILACESALAACPHDDLMAGRWRLPDAG